MDVMRKKQLTAAQRNAIAGESGVAPNTIVRWETGKTIRPVSRTRIESAIERLAKGKRP